MKAMKAMKVLFVLAVSFPQFACSAGAPPAAVHSPASSAGLASDATSVVIPDLSGQDGATAGKALRALGLTVEYQSDSGKSVIVASNWTVLATHPSAGSPAMSESKITVHVAKPARTSAPESAMPIAPPDPPAPSDPEQPAVPSSTWYANCAEARAAGAAPIFVGEPGYSTKLDRDKDGVACE
ncbi:excalibur calcium-binding domain-containing protein [Leifsonia sp. McL0607]|uniref:excalibur calcium-binding domain-containing protein n=1 Tax=Leifsonia sp. McL0607 TaxID=3415672 RepID=UPI003CF2E7BB